LSHFQVRLIQVTGQSGRRLFYIFTILLSPLIDLLRRPLAVEIKQRLIGELTSVARTEPLEEKLSPITSVMTVIVVEDRAERYL
jgi:hypothetical protein